MDEKTILILSKDEHSEIMKCKIIVDMIFNDCRYADNFYNSYLYTVNQEMLRKMFPEKCKEAEKRAKEKYEEGADLNV